MPTAARYPPTRATYKAPREQYWHPQYLAVPKTYAAVLGVVTCASSLKGFGRGGFSCGSFCRCGVSRCGFSSGGFSSGGFGFSGISRREEPQRGSCEGSPS